MFDSTKRDRSPFSIALQRTLGRLFIIPLGFLIVALIKYKYRLALSNIHEVRAKFKEICARAQKEHRPLVICPNHLTMVDSALLLWACAPLTTYLFHYHLFAWNIPAIENYQSKPLWRLVTYLSKCIPIDRHGDAAHIDRILSQLRTLIREGDLCMIFPEGTRSRTGRIQRESAGYGIGKILKDIPGCGVICAYLRGHTQEICSDFPAKGDELSLTLRYIEPSTTAEGLRAVRDISQQVISTLKEMEDEYFEKTSR